MNHTLPMPSTWMVVISLIAHSSYKFIYLFLQYLSRAMAAWQDACSCNDAQLKLTLTQKS